MSCQYLLRFRGGYLGLSVGHSTNNWHMDGEKYKMKKSPREISIQQFTILFLHNPIINKIMSARLERQI
jgi:hypothetical protein